MLEEHWRGNRVAEVLSQEGDDLAGHLELWDIAIEVDPVKALEVQHDMTIKDIVDVDRLRHSKPPPAIQPTRCFTAIRLIVLRHMASRSEGAN